MIALETEQTTDISHIIPLDLHPWGFNRRLEAAAMRLKAIESLPDVRLAKETLSKKGKWMAVVHTLQDVVRTMGETDQDVYWREMTRLQARIRKEGASPDGGWWYVVDLAFNAVVSVCADNLAALKRN